MGKVDVISRQYLKNNDVFADIVNLMEFAGQDVVTPDMLREMDTAEQQVIVAETAALTCQVCSVDIKIELKEEKGEMSMCKAFEDMKEEGREEGKLVTLIALVCRKLRKRNKAEEIAEILKEDCDLIQRICTVAEQCGPNYDEKRIFEILWSEKA